MKVCLLEMKQVENLSNTIICRERNLVLMDSAQKTKQNWRQNLCLCLICTENTTHVCHLTRIGTDSGQSRPRVFIQDTLLVYFILPYRH